MYYGDMKDLTGTFSFGFFIITKKFITLWLESWKEKHKKIEFISRFKYA